MSGGNCTFTEPSGKPVLAQLVQVYCSNPVIVGPIAAFLATEAVVYLIPVLFRSMLADRTALARIFLGNAYRH